MNITILGSGTSVPSARRRAPAYLIRHEDVALLMDCGSGCTTSLARAGQGLEMLSGILLTHLHPDHTADLLPLLFALANPLHTQRSTDLPLWGPVGVGDYYRALDGLYGRWVHPLQGEVVVNELDDGDSIQLGDLTCVAHRVHHSQGSLAFRLEAEGMSVCFSGDSGPCSGLEQAARGVDLLICECSLLEDEEVEGHMRASDVGRLAASAGCGRVILTHLYEHIEDSKPVQRVRQLYSGPVILAEDGMEIALT